MACAKLYIALGAKVENIYMFDSKGLICAERTDLDDYSCGSSGFFNRLWIVAMEQCNGFV